MRQSLFLRSRFVLLLLFSLWGLSIFLQGCASAGGGQKPPPEIVVTISPMSATVQTGKTQQFTATVLNSANTRVSWQVNGINGGDSVHGTVSSVGMYTAPTTVPSSAIVRVTAIAQANSAKSASASITITDAPVPLSISTISLPSGQINVVYSTTLAATGGTTPYTWSLTSGTLPSGLSLNASTGAITGTPTVSVTSTPLTFQAKDSSSPQQSKTVNLTLSIAPATLVISTTSLPSGQINVAYSTALAASGGTTPYTWSLTSGTLPSGLSLNASTGAITGTPTVSVTSTPLTFQAKDSSSPQQSKTVNLTLSIAPATLVISTTSLPSGQINVAYSTALAASGGTTPYTWSLTSGTLPSGLSLNASTGAITGTPTVSVTSTPLTFQAKDSSSPQQSKTVNLTLSIAPATLVISTTSLPSGQINVAYSTALAASGGTTPYTWSLTSGTLPSGLSLNASTGAITGTPTVSVTSTPLTFQAKDSSSPQQSKTVNLTLSIAPATLVISTTSLPSGQINVAYSTALAASGGTTPYTWSLTSGTLPSGLSLNASTGAITGTPTVSVTSTPLTFQAKDSSSPQQSKTVNLTLSIAPATLVISTTSLPSGQINVAYSTALAASGGTTPYTWSLTSGTLPSGLSLNASTGAITGTPTVSVTSTPLTFQAKDSSSPQQSKTVNLTLSIAPATLVISTTSLPSGQINVAYSTALAASGGTTPYTWSLTSGTLPSGLSLNASTGAITGTPTVSVTSTPLTFQAKDSSSPQQSKTVNLTLSIAPATLVISTTSLPSGQINVAYSTALAASGGTTPYTWSLTSGTLPSGLSLNASTGAITGTPTVSVTSTPLTFQAKDSSSPQQSKTVNLTLSIAPATLVISTTSLPSGQINVAYSTALAASGGTTPYTWSLTSGTLPSGLSLNASTGAITGTPTVSVTSTPLTFQAKDSSSPQQSKTVNLTLSIAPATLVISTTSLPSGQINVAYSTALAASGGTTPYTWSLTSGTLPSGLSLNASTGAITGTPTVSVTSTPLTFQAKDSSSPQQSKTVNLTLSIAPATLVISTTSLPSGQINVAYSTALAASGGTTPYTWSLTSGTLPSGLSLNASTGAITGTPTVSVTSTPLTFQAKDSSSPQQSKTVNLTLSIAPATLVISTTSLPSGQINVAYSTALAASGGTTPYTWSLTSGTLPSGLSLNASTGAITGTPTVSVTSTPLTFQAKDSSSPQQSKTVNLTLSIGTGANITVSLLPKRGGATITQLIQLTATVTNDVGNAGVTWMVSGGTLTGQTHSTASFSATSAGIYTVTATSIVNPAASATATFGVTDYTAMPTYHNDLARDGVNAKEYTLSPANVSQTTFGKLFTCTVDAPIYAQPLWVANLSIGGGTHNVVFVATVHNTVYAFDADGSSCVKYWQRTLMGSGETWVTSTELLSDDIDPDIGIIGTPVIDTSTNALFVVSKSKNSGTSCSPASACHQRLYSVSLIDGTDKTGSPVDLTTAITVPGTGNGSSGGNIAFDTLRQNQRPGLALVGGVVYITWASHGDQGAYHGWIIGFDKNTLARVVTHNTTPNGRQGGIWMSGGAPAADSSNNLYVITGNGDYDGTNDFGDSFLKFSTTADSR